MRIPRLSSLVSLSLAILAVCGAFRASADIITLRNGHKIEGTVISETVSDGTRFVNIEIHPGAIQPIPKDDIATIEKFTTPEAELARRRAALEADKSPAAQPWYELGVWAADKKLEAEAKRCFERAIALFPDHALARARLGYERAAEGWITYAEAQKRRGLVEWSGRWMRPEEKEKLESGYVRDADGNWIKREALDAKRAAEEEAERKQREFENESLRRAGERASAPTGTSAPATTSSGGGTPARSGGPSIVVQFNLRFDFPEDKGTKANPMDNSWAKRAPLIAALIEDARADVACFQEDKQDQVEDLRDLLKTWEFVGAGRDGRRSERCSVAFDTRRWRCAEHGDFWLSDTPDKVGSNTWGSKYPHKVTWAHLESADAGPARDAIFTSTHLDEARDLDEVRQKSARVIRAWLSQHAAGANVVVCGDFNAGTEERPDLLTYDLMTSATPAPALIDAFLKGQRVFVKERDTDQNTGTCHEFTGKARKKRIDWMFVGGNVAPLTIEIDQWHRREADGDHYPSDHFAVVGQLQIGPRGRSGN